MPHDLNGKQLSVGDLVLLPCVVTAIHAGEEYCNASLETVQPMYPGEHKTAITVNTRQCELLDKGEPDA